MQRNHRVYVKLKVEDGEMTCYGAPSALERALAIADQNEATRRFADVGVQELIDGYWCNMPRRQVRNLIKAMREREAADAAAEVSP